MVAIVQYFVLIVEELAGLTGLKLSHQTEHQSGPAVVVDYFGRFQKAHQSVFADCSVRTSHCLAVGSVVSCSGQIHQKAHCLADSVENFVRRDLLTVVVVAA